MIDVDYHYNTFYVILKALKDFQVENINVNFTVSDIESITYLLGELKANKEREISCSERQQWIPCSERLPKQGQEVICQCRASIIKVLKLDANGYWYQDANNCYMGGFVIAWMPLPEPWRGEQK